MQGHAGFCEQNTQAMPHSVYLIFRHEQCHLKAFTGHWSNEHGCLLAQGPWLISGTFEDRACICPLAEPGGTPRQQPRGNTNAPDLLLIFVAFSLTSLTRFTNMCVNDSVDPIHQLLAGCLDVSTTENQVRLEVNPRRHATSQRSGGQRNQLQENVWEKRGWMPFY